MSASPKTANAVQARLKELYKCIKQIEDARKSSEGTLQQITSTHRRVEATGELSYKNRSNLLIMSEEVHKIFNFLKKFYKKFLEVFEKINFEIYQAIGDAEKEEECLRKALGKIYDIRKIRHEIRMAARSAGNKETIRRGALMKMLATSAETIPLWVGRENESPPPLCGAIPSDSNYVAQVRSVF